MVTSSHTGDDPSGPSGIRYSSTVQPESLRALRQASPATDRVRRSKNTRTDAIWVWVLNLSARWAAASGPYRNSRGSSAILSAAGPRRRIFIYSDRFMGSVLWLLGIFVESSASRTFRLSGSAVYRVRINDLLNTFYHISSISISGSSYLRKFSNQLSLFSLISSCNSTKSSFSISPVSNMN